jgi:hypothetical protein
LSLERYLKPDPEKLYYKYREIFYQHLAKYDSWKEYLADHLNQSYEFRFDRSYFVEKMIHNFKRIMFNAFFEKNKEYAFFKQFEPIYPEYSKFFNTLDHYEKFNIESIRKGKILKVELLNFKKDQLYYPNIKYLNNIHSALHSLAMTIFVKTKLLSENEINHMVNLHFTPSLTHPIDRAYTTYYSMLLKLPLILIERYENLSWIIQKNRVPKVGKLGRWCTRFWKSEVGNELYIRFFHPLQYKLSQKAYKKYVEEKRGKRSKGIPIPKSTKHEANPKKFQVLYWDKTEDEWVESGEYTNEIPIFRKITKRVGNVDRFIGWEKDQTQFPDTITAYNVINFIAINKNQSVSRSRENPNLKFHPKANPKRNYLIYNYYPIFNLTYQDLISLVKGYEKPIKVNPYDLEYGNLFNPDPEVPKKEVRFGCVYCPYKRPDYYELLKKTFPEAYWYCHLLRTIASASNIIEEGREYYWWSAEFTPREIKKHPEWDKLM